MVNIWGDSLLGKGETSTESTQSGRRPDSGRDPVRDARLVAETAPLFSAWQREAAVRAKRGAPSEELEQFRWLLEELRVSLYAQELRTPTPVSVKRLAKLWATMR